MKNAQKKEVTDRKTVCRERRCSYILVSLLIVCLICTGLAGCASPASNPTAEAESTQDETASAPADTDASPGNNSQETSVPNEEAVEPATEAAPSVKEWLVMGEEPKEAWIVAFDSLNVRRFCYSRGTVIGKFAGGQKVTVTGPARYGFYPVSGTDAETGEEIRGYCSADYVSFREYTGNAVSLEIVRYVQTDEPWKDLNLGESRYTIGQAGCTTTCFAMCESYLTGTEVTPDIMWANLEYSNQGDLYWPETYYQDYSSDYLFKIYQKLHQGIPVLIGARTKSGSQHWVLVTGYDPGEKEITSSSQLKSADFTINDPASKGRQTLSEFFRDLPYFIKFAYYIGE